MGSKTTVFAAGTGTPVNDVGEITALAAATLALDYLCLRGKGAGAVKG